MTRKETKEKLVKIVEAVGHSIIDEADNIVSDHEYGKGLKIEIEIGTDMIPEIKVTRGFITSKVIDALRKE